MVDLIVLNSGVQATIGISKIAKSIFDEIQHKKINKDINLLVQFDKEMEHKNKRNIVKFIVMTVYNKCLSEESLKVFSEGISLIPERIVPVGVPNSFRILKVVPAQGKYHIFTMTGETMDITSKDREINFDILIDDKQYNITVDMYEILTSL